MEFFFFFDGDDVYKEILTTQIEMFNPIQTGLVFLVPAIEGGSLEVSLSNFKTARSTATKITFHSQPSLRGP